MKKDVSGEKDFEFRDRIRRKRIREIARMLSGEQITDSVLDWQRNVGRERSSMKEVEVLLEQKVGQEKTRKIYRRDLEQLREFLEKSFLEAEEEELRKYFEVCQGKLKESSLRRKQVSFESFYQYIVDRKKNKRNPFPLLMPTQRKQEKEKKERLSEEEYQCLLSNLSEK